MLNTSNTINYSFANTSKARDTAPEWMDNFFNNYLNQSKNNDDNIKIAKLFNITAKDHHCNCCGNKLEDNEVTFCKACINKAMN